MSVSGNSNSGRLTAAVPGGRSSALLVYTLSHAAVDLACGYILYAMCRTGAVSAGNAAALFLLYNTLAFGLQFIIGAVCDRRDCCRATAVVGCLLTAAGVLVGSSAPVATVILVGIGNAAFHSGGGCDTLRHTEGMSGSGIFVSSGALGLALGMKLGESGKLPVHALFVIMLFSAAAVFLFCGEKYADGSSVPFRGMPPLDFEKNPRRLLPLIRGEIAAVFICLFAIVVRSYTGFAAVSPGFDGKFAFLYVAFCAFAGKLAGGVLADLLGARRVGVASLVLSVPLFWLGAERGIFYLAAVFLFNIAMPITLCTVARRLPGHEGFAFGLNTLALLVGYIASRAEVSAPTARILTLVLTLLAAVVVLLTVSDERPAAVAKPEENSAE